MKYRQPGVLRLIGISRIVRPILDCTVWVLSLLGYVLAQELTHENQSNSLAHQRLSKTLVQQANTARSGFSFSSIDQQFKSEPEMWAGFQGWLATKGSRSGQCSFSVVTAELPYRLQCTGSTLPSQKPAAQAMVGTMPTVLTSEPIAVQPNKANTETRPMAVENTPNQLTVQGWVDTSQGRKHFDPKTKLWTR